MCIASAGPLHVPSSSQPGCPVLCHSILAGPCASAAPCSAEARSQGLQQQVSSRLSEPQGRGLGPVDSTLRTDSASEATTGLHSSSGLVRDSAVDGTPGLHATRGREGSGGGRLAAEQTSSNMRNGAGEGQPSGSAPIGTQAAGHARGSASNAAGAGACAGMQGPSARPMSAFEMAPSMLAAGFVRDSASEETAGPPMAVAGRQDSANEHLLSASTEAGASSLQEVQLGFHFDTARGCDPNEPALEVPSCLIVSRSVVHARRMYTNERPPCNWDVLCSQGPWGLHHPWI